MGSQQIWMHLGSMGSKARHRKVGEDVKVSSNQSLSVTNIDKKWEIWTKSNKFKSIWQWTRVTILESYAYSWKHSGNKRANSYNVYRKKLKD